mmetsp:Transcript_2145/g.4584  ORF Transcript_2145/g.4584 Transcript_2145/m.4584 type:complete len:264 (+) Transcript_2145:234-1025(+)
MRMSRWQRNRIHLLLHTLHQLGVRNIHPILQRTLQHTLPLCNHALLYPLPIRHLQSILQQRFVRHGLPSRQYPPRRRYDHLGFAIINPTRQLLRRETAKDDRMDGTDARARQHGHDGLGNHGHVDHDRVALGNTQIGQPGGERRHLLQKLRISVRSSHIENRRIVNERGLLRSRLRGMVDMPIEAIVTRVELAVGEPLVHSLGPGMVLERVFEGGGSVPVQFGRGAEPVAAVVAEGLVVFLLVGAKTTGGGGSGGERAELTWC